jgi:hypothetical protein
MAGAVPTSSSPEGSLILFQWRAAHAEQASIQDQSLEPVGQRRRPVGHHRLADDRVCRARRAGRVCIGIRSKKNPEGSVMGTLDGSWLEPLGLKVEPVSASIPPQITIPPYV